MITFESRNTSGRFVAGRLPRSSGSGLASCSIYSLYDEDRSLESRSASQHPCSLYHMDEESIPEVCHSWAKGWRSSR
jgi:hypothetical protein